MKRGTCMRIGKHIIALVALALATALLVTGCDRSKTPANANGTSAPKSLVNGYYSTDQSLSGGTDLRYINLRDIKIEKTQTDTVISLEFKEGSLQLGMKESPTKGVPLYNTQWIEGVDRLVLNINGPVYWDYKIYEDELKDTPILGVFKQTPVDDPEAMLTKLYINLKDDIAYKIEEKDNVLMLYIRAMPEDERSDFYVMLNAFDEFTDGKISEEEGLLPTLCKDKTNVMLISKPFATEAEANTFLDEKQKSLLPALPGKNVIVMELKNNQLPDYDEKGALAAYANANVTRNGSVESPAPVLITNGKILCWKPDGMAYVYVAPFFLGGSDSAVSMNYEKIYISNFDSTTPTLLTDFEYTSIIKAEFSDDGNYLAFIDEDGPNRLLYIYDFKNSTKQVATASEAGFGADTAAFTWGSGDYANTIFAITGEGETLQLMAYTQQAGSTGPKVETLVENAFTQGSMGFFDGKVYYSQQSVDSSQNGVFSFDPATKITNRICDGLEFEMNRKTGAMAISTGQGLKIFYPRTRTDKVVVENKSIFSSVWATDGSELYYTVYKYDPNTNERYKLTLYQYNTLTKENTEITDIVEGDFKPSDKNSEILMVCIYNQEDQFFVPITYRIEANK